MNCQLKYAPAPKEMIYSQGVYTHTDRQTRGVFVVCVANKVHKSVQEVAEEEGSNSSNSNSPTRLENISALSNRHKQQCKVWHATPTYIC